MQSISQGLFLFSPFPYLQCPSLIVRNLVPTVLHIITYLINAPEYTNLLLLSQHMDTFFFPLGFQHPIPTVSNMWMPFLPSCVLTLFSELFLTGLPPMGALLTNLGPALSSELCSSSCSGSNHLHWLPAHTYTLSSPSTYSPFSTLDTFLCRCPSQNTWKHSGPPPS